MGSSSRDIRLTGTMTGTAPPTAPANLTAAAVSSSQIDLTWTDSDTETGFMIERCTGAGCSDFAQIATVGANVTSYSDTGLAAATSYTYRVRAYNAGDSDYSNTASATTQAAPAARCAEQPDCDCRLEQPDRPGLDGHGDTETGFKIERCKGRLHQLRADRDVGANVTSYSNTGLSSNTAYSYRVRAYKPAAIRPTRHRYGNDTKTLTGVCRAKVV